MLVACGQRQTVLLGCCSYPYVILWNWFSDHCEIRLNLTIEICGLLIWLKEDAAAQKCPHLGQHFRWIRRFVCAVKQFTKDTQWHIYVTDLINFLVEVGIMTEVAYNHSGIEKDATSRAHLFVRNLLQ